MYDEPRGPGGVGEGGGRREDLEQVPRRIFARGSSGNAKSLRRKSAQTISEITASALSSGSGSRRESGVIAAALGMSVQLADDVLRQVGARGAGPEGRCVDTVDLGQDLGAEVGDERRGDQNESHELINNTRRKTQDLVGALSAELESEPEDGESRPSKHEQVDPAAEQTLERPGPDAAEDGDPRGKSHEGGDAGKRGAHKAPNPFQRGAQDDVLGGVAHGLTGMGHKADLGILVRGPSEDLRAAPGAHGFPRAGRRQVDLLDDGVVVNREELVDRSSGKGRPISHQLMRASRADTVSKEPHVSGLGELHRQRVPHGQRVEADDDLFSIQLGAVRPELPEVGATKDDVKGVPASTRGTNDESVVIVPQVVTIHDQRAAPRQYDGAEEAPGGQRPSPPVGAPAKAVLARRINDEAVRIHIFSHGKGPHAARSGTRRGGLKKEGTRRVPLPDEREELGPVGVNDPRRAGRIPSGDPQDTRLLVGSQELVIVKKASRVEARTPGPADPRRLNRQGDLPRGPGLSASISLRSQVRS